MEHLDSAGAYTGPTGPTHWVEHLRVATMSVGTYSIPAGGTDDQTPHAEDEIYVVATGRARFTCDGRTLAVEPGDTLFVAAGEDHRFHDVTEDLALLVVFAPPYSGD